MTEKTLNTGCGTIHYWISDDKHDNRLTLIFLPGLTADHQLFGEQVDYFAGR